MGPKAPTSSPSPPCSAMLENNEKRKHRVIECAVSACALCCCCPILGLYRFVKLPFKIGCWILRRARRSCSACCCPNYHSDRNRILSAASSSFSDLDFDSIRHGGENPVLGTRNFGSSS